MRAAPAAKSTYTGVTARTFTVTVNNDIKDEPDEMIALALANPVNATLGDPTTATLSVIDDDPPPVVQYSRSAYTVTANAGSATITVALNTVSAFTVNVTYTVGATSGQVAFAPGVTVMTFTVTIINDTQDEPTESVPLLLSSPVNAVLSSLAEATLSVLDNDSEPTVQFAANAYTVTRSTGVLS